MRLDGAAYILHGSDDGLVVEVDHPSRSSLYTRIILPADDDDRMPPKGDPLTIREQEIIRKWIAQGADFGKWVGAKDGIEDLANKRAMENLHIPAHISFYESLANNLSALPEELLKGISERTGLMVRPIGKGSSLVEVRKVSDEYTINDRTMETLLPLSDHLTKLDLTASDISDEACSTIGRFQLLTILSLRKTEVGDIGLKKLKVLKNLQSFNLTETKVSDYGIAPLLEFEKLRNLHLWGTKISSERLKF